MAVIQDRALTRTRHLGTDRLLPHRRPPRLGFAGISTAPLSPHRAFPGSLDPEALLHRTHWPGAVIYGSPCCALQRG